MTQSAFHQRTKARCPSMAKAYDADVPSGFVAGAAVARRLGDGSAGRDRVHGGRSLEVGCGVTRPVRSCGHPMSPSCEAKRRRPTARRPAYGFGWLVDYGGPAKHPRDVAQRRDVRIPRRESKRSRRDGEAIVDPRELGGLSSKARSHRIFVATHPDAAPPAAAPPWAKASGGDGPRARLVATLRDGRYRSFAVERHDVDN